MNSQLQIPQQYSDQEQEQFLEKLTEELLCRVALKGEQHGKKNQPATEDELRALILDKIETQVQVGLDDNRKRHLMESSMAIAKKIYADAQQQAVRIDAEINDATDRVADKEQERNKCEPNLDRVRNRKYTNYGLGVLAVAEAYFAYEALRHANVPKIPAFFISAGIGFGIGWGMHIMAAWILKAENRQKQYLRYGLVLAIAFIAFATLGHLRADAYNNAINLHLHPGQILTPTGSVSGWALTILSFILFWVALAFSIKYHKTEEESEREQQYNKLCGEIQALNTEIENLENKKQQIEEDARTQAGIALLRLEYAITNENRLETLTRLAYVAYKDKNNNFRTDGIPAFYANMPVFRLKYYFKNFKTSNYETNNVPPRTAHVE